ncbi:MAG TPA: glycosyltransferase family 39 protein [Aridibacter sp.]|nr:glycosyltransferase family 39 protein [Aridibacter sp.]
MSVAVAIACVKLLIFAYVGGSYGYFRDELYFLACADHLALGYPDHAPLSVYVTEFSRSIFGESLHAIRLFPAIAGSLRIVITGLLVREFGGRHFAVLISCLAVLVAPSYLAVDNLLGMNYYESVFWMGCVLSFIWAVRREDPKYWILFGAFAGLGLMNKHSMVFFGAALTVALLLSRYRKVFTRPHIWMAAAIAFVIFVPNLVWQYQNDWATLELLRNVRESGKNVEVSAIEFTVQQMIMLNPVTIAVWLPGLALLLSSRWLAEFRVLGITFVLLFAAMLALNAKNYYLAPVYPFLFAAGGVFWERLLGRSAPGRAALCTFAALLILAGTALAPLAVPALPVDSYKSYETAIGIAPPKTEVAHEGVLPQHFGDMFGWEEMVEKTARVYRSLPDEERERAAIFASNYGEAGAIDHFGPRYGLPRAISPHQSYYLWGFGDYDGRIAILLGVERESAEQVCGSVEVREPVGGRFNMTYENFDILVCRDLKPPVDEFWKQIKNWN